MPNVVKCMICQQEYNFSLNGKKHNSKMPHLVCYVLKGGIDAFICEICSTQLKNQLVDRESFMNFYHKDDLHDHLMVEDEHEIFEGILRGSSDICVELINKMLSNYSAGGLFIDQDQLDEMKEIYADDEDIFLGDLSKYLSEITDGVEHLNNDQDDGDCDVTEELTFFCKNNCKTFITHGESGCVDVKCGEYGYCCSCVNQDQCIKLKHKCKLALKNEQKPV